MLFIATSQNLVQLAATLIEHTPVLYLNRQFDIKHQIIKIQIIMDSPVNGLQNASHVTW